MDILDDYIALQNQIFDYFGYVEDWRRLPLEDSREFYWFLTMNESGGGFVTFAETREQLTNEEAGDYYSDEIFTQRHLPKWVYRGEDYTMVCVDTHTDGNQFLRIFRNEKEIKP